MHGMIRTAGRAGRALAIPALLLTLLVPGAADARLSVSNNYRLQDPAGPGRGKDAVSMAVDPANPKHIVEVNADWDTGVCEHHVSFDGGRHWKGADAFVAPEEFGVRSCSVGPHLAEHMQSGGIAFGSGQNVYATIASPKPKLPEGAEEGKSLMVSVSRDGGRTFGPLQVVARGGDSDDTGTYVLPTINVDRARPGGPSQDRVYVAAAFSKKVNGVSAEDVVVAASNDAGATFGPPIAADAAGANSLEESQPVVARDGTVYITWRERGKPINGKPNPQGFVVVGKSADQGKTWTQVKAAPVTGYTYNGPPSPPFSPGQIFTASTFPRMAIDPRNDTLYVVFGQGPLVLGGRSAGRAKAHASDHFINPDQDVYFMRSTDGAATWTTPRRLNSTPVNKTEITQTRHPWVSVAPNGRVDIAWQDRRHWYRGCTNTHAACQETRLGDTYYIYSKDGEKFSRNFRLTDRSIGLDVGFDYRFGTGWAYGPVVVPTGDNSLLVSWMDSRRGNLENDTQDIYMARVGLAAKGPLPVRRVHGASGAPAFSVALSRLAYPGGPEAVLNSTFVTRPWTRLVIVNKDDVPGALAGGVLARANIGTVLAAPAGGLTAAQKAEAARMEPVGAYIVGDESKLSPQVVSDLAAVGVPTDQIVRLSGTDEADTARLIAASADRRTQAQKDAGVPAFNAAIIVNPQSADAVTASVLAANRRLPVLFVDRDSVPAATAQALKDLAISSTVVVGNSSVIGDGVVSQMPSPLREGGKDASNTSRFFMTAEQVVRGVPDNIMYVTNGRSPMQAALLGAAVGRIGGLQLVSRHGIAGARLAVRRSVTLRSSVTRLVSFVK